MVQFIYYLIHKLPKSFAGFRKSSKNVHLLNNSSWSSFSYRRLDNGNPDSVPLKTAALDSEVALQLTCFPFNS